ncbi:MAG: FUSC family protein [Romboutsia sp.]|uniref:FUSC family protein n=1 Tax=Romboutsia sp. TaxID=1965302 RepID=UPI003F2BFCFC
MTYQLKIGGDLINKQEFITKTLTFIANSIFINIFAKIFGMSNSIVAVSIVVIALTLVSIDLRENIVRKTFYISIVMLIIGVAATLININPILGLVINIVVTFFIIYEGVNTYKENTYFPFLLAYIFMGLSVPASLEQLPIRMASIVVGCVYILIIQLVLNRDRFNKTLFHTKKQLISVTIRKIDSLIAGNENNSDTKVVYSLTQPIVRAIYDNRLTGKVVSTKNKGELSIVLSIEKIYKALCDLKNVKELEEDELEVIYKIKEVLELLNDYMYGSKNKNLIKEKIVICVEELDECTNDETTKSIIEAVKELPYDIYLIEAENENTTDKSQHIKNIFKPINTNSASFKFAIKLSLSISILILIFDIFDVTYGRWILFPAIAIIQPYFDGTVKKSIDRVVGTLIGIVLFVIIFTLVKDNMVRLNITIFLAYINLFMKKYHISTSLVAVSALGSVAMGGAGIEILMWRLAFTAIGCVLGLIINKCIYSCTLKQYVEDVVEEYDMSIKKINELDVIPSNEAKIYDAILKSKLLEYKISQYSKEVMDIIYQHEDKKYDIILKSKQMSCEIAQTASN